MIGFTFWATVTPAQSAAPTSICYLSLNTDVEKATLEKLLRKSSPGVQVHEFQSEGNSPEDSLRELIESGKRCDVLVISGHHSGSYWGERADGQLRLELLEQFSCHHPEWFSNIKVVYLQGCRSLGSSVARRSDDEVRRVLGALERGEDQGDVNSADLASGFDSIYDEFDPLPKQHAAIFPKAKIFGYTDTAPTAGISEFTIPNHLKNAAKLLSRQSKKPASVTTTLSKMLTASSTKTTQMFGLAWEFAGKAGKRYKMAHTPNYDHFAWTLGVHVQPDFRNSDVGAKMLTDRCEFLTEEDWTKKKEKALEGMLSSEELITMNLGVLRESLNDQLAASEMVEKLRSSATFQKLLSKRISNQRLSLLGRLKFYEMYLATRIENQSDPYLADLLKQTYPVLSSSDDSDAMYDVQMTLLDSFPLRNDEQLFSLDRVAREEFYRHAIHWITNTGEIATNAILGRLTLEPEFFRLLKQEIQRTDDNLSLRTLRLSWGPYVQSKDVGLLTNALREHAVLGDFANEIFTKLVSMPELIPVFFRTIDELNTSRSDRLVSQFFSELAYAQLGSRDLSLLKSKLTDPVFLESLLSSIPKRTEVSLVESTYYTDIHPFISADSAPILFKYMGTLIEGIPLLTLARLQTAQSETFLLEKLNTGTPAEQISVMKIYGTGDRRTPEAARPVLERFAETGSSELRAWARRAIWRITH
ncbi:MAG: hypothetical protein A2X94_10350 [Bdellovibrionales bacterium GWB1_55_8]|nr:MAG: hypothetical protein A2X94_10350 [Bdellovibrionales bacterium GWB1_55_8]